MTAFTAKLALLVVALALLASYASAACSITHCTNCALANPNLCLVCDPGYKLTSTGSCLAVKNSAVAPQSLVVAVLIVLSAMLTYVL
jgi:hypothetical protein